MEGFALDYFKNDNIVREFNSSSEFYSYLSEYNKQVAPATHAHMMNIYQKLMGEYMIKENNSNVWDEKMVVQSNIDVHYLFIWSQLFH